MLLIINDDNCSNSYSAYNKSVQPHSRLTMDFIGAIVSGNTKMIEDLVPVTDGMEGIRMDLIRNGLEDIMRNEIVI